MVGARCSRSDAGPPTVLALEFDADDHACAAQHGLREDLVKRTSRPAFDGMPCLVLLGLVLVLVLVRPLHDCPARSSGSRSKAILAEGMESADRVLTER